jgi:hypothetical protein
MHVLDWGPEKQKTPGGKCKMPAALTSFTDLSTIRETTTAQRQAQRLCIVAIICSAAFFIASPFMTLWTIASALQNNDMPTLGRAINWSSLDNCLKEQIIAGLELHSPEPDELPDFGQSFATNVVSNAIDTRVTQANLSKVIAEIMPPGAIGKQLDGRALVQVVEHATGRFTRPDVFEAKIVLPGHQNESPLGIQLKIEGWRWKLTRVDLPVSRPVIANANPATRKAA